jgi:hypothetical protein
VTRAAFVLAGAAALVYLGFVVPQLGRPLMYDDANFALAIRAVADTGRPYGNQGWMSERSDFSQREQWALWHPPLYVYADGVLARLGGWSPPVMRLLGVFGGLATAALTFLCASSLTRGTPGIRRLAGGIAVALTMLCPLVIQSTLILDIDFPVLLPLTLLFLLLYMHFENTRRHWLWLVPLFALMLWAKMTNPLPLIGVIFVWQVLRGRPLRAVAHATTIGAGGAVLFGGSWLAIGRWLDFPLDMPFGVNLVQWQDSAQVARAAYRSPAAFIEALQPTVLWLGPPLVACGLAGIALRAAQLARCWHVRSVDLIIGVITVFVLGYANKDAGWFPKYQVAFGPLLACVAAPLLARAWCTRPRLTSAVCLVSVAVSAPLVWRMARDDWALQRTWRIETSLGTALLALVVLGTLIGLRWRAVAPAACATMAALAIGWSLALDVAQLRARYATTYWYGTTGTVEAAAWLDAHVRPEQIYLAAKEVAIRARVQRYVDQDNLVYFVSAGRGFDGTWAQERLAALVVWEREPFVTDLLREPIRKSGFLESARFGDYVIYEPALGS